MRSILLVASLFAWNVSYAQEQFANFGEFLAKGGKKLSSEDAKKEITTGVKTTTVTSTGTQLAVEYKPNNTVSGYASSPRGSSGIIGTWRFENEAGRLCAQ